MRWSPRFSNLTVAAGVWLLFEVMYWHPGWVFFIGAAAAALFAARSFSETRSLIIRTRAVISFFLSATLLTWTALGFSLLLERFAVRQLLALITALGAMLLFDSMHTYIFSRAEYKGYALENIVSYTLTLSIFFGSGVLYGLHGLLDVSLAMIVAVFGVIVGVAGMIFFGVGSPARGQNRIAGLTAGFVTLQLFGVFMALPFHFVVSGAAITVLWYVAHALSRARIFGTLTPEVARRHLVLGSALMIVLFTSVRWV